MSSLLRFGLNIDLVLKEEKVQAAKHYIVVFELKSFESEAVVDVVVVVVVDDDVVDEPFGVRSELLTTLSMKASMQLMAESMKCSLVSMANVE